MYVNLFYFFYHIIVKGIQKVCFCFMQGRNIIIMNRRPEVRMRELKNRSAIITGGTGGLGKAVLSVFLEEGAKVLSTYLVDRQLKDCSGVKDKYGAALSFAKADVTKPKQAARVVEKAVKKLGRVDILVNIVGGFCMSGIVDTDETMWDRMMDMNLKPEEIAHVIAFLCSGEADCISGAVVPVLGRS